MSRVCQSYEWSVLCCFLTLLFEWLPREKAGGRGGQAALVLIPPSVIAVSCMASPINQIRHAKAVFVVPCLRLSRLPLSASPVQRVLAFVSFFLPATVFSPGRRGSPRPSLRESESLRRLSFAVYRNFVAGIRIADNPPPPQVIFFLRLCVRL